MNDTLPISPAVPRRRWSWWWLAPIVALLVVTALGVQALRARGDLVTLRFAQGHGLKPGDSLRHRGVQVGGVIAVALTTDTASVVVRVRLHPSARALARVGSRFWVVRPQLSLEGATGLDTLVGPLYLAVEPGDGRPARAFTGLEVAPVLGVGQRFYFGKSFSARVDAMDYVYSEEREHLGKVKKGTRHAWTVMLGLSAFLLGSP